jgi:hypothetical protein
MNLIWRMRSACWTINATNTHTAYVILRPFHCNHSYTKEPPCYILSTLRLLLHIKHVNKQRITIPPFPFTIIFNATISFRNIIYIFIYLFTYLSTYIVIMYSQCRSPEHTGHTVHIRIFFINTKYSDQRCEECHVWSSSNSD